MATNPQTSMPPVPREPMLDQQGRMSLRWEKWIQQLQRILSFSGGIGWGIVDKAGSSLSDIVTRPHSMLQSILGWASTTDAVQNRHISDANGKVWQDHVEVTNGNPHGTDWDMLEGTANHIPLNQSPSGVPTAPGTIAWNAIDGTVDFRLLNGVTLQGGQEINIYGKASGNINNGELCQYAGVQGDHTMFKKAVASEIIANPHFCIGVATQNIANGDFGYVTWFGKINGVYTKSPANNDSVDWVEEDVLYFDNTTGQLTKIPPDAPAIRIIVAAVIKTQTGSSENGVIIVRPSFGIRFVDCDDVDGLPSAHGDFYTWNNTAGYFEPSRKIGDGTNYTEFESNGTIKLNGSATVWNDINLSIGSLRPGATGPGTYTIAGTSIIISAFTGTGLTQSAHGSMEILHDYKHGSDIVPHIHWCPTTTGAGNVVWQLEYAWVNGGGTISASTTISAIAAATTVVGQEVRTSFPAISGTDKTMGSRFVFRIFRDPAHSSDTYGADAGVFDIGVHYEIDTMGSREIATK